MSDQCLPLSSLPLCRLLIIAVNTFEWTCEARTSQSNECEHDFWIRRRLKNEAECENENQMRATSKIEEREMIQYDSDRTWLGYIESDRILSCRQENRSVRERNDLKDRIEAHAHTHTFSANPFLVLLDSMTLVR